MIRLTRVRTAKAIPAAFRGAKRVQRNRDLVTAFQTGALEFQASVWKAAKNQLKRESFGKCAYCEAPTAVVAHGDVEHFRPKSVYWWLAYCYENYTYSCQICNQVNKGDRFPVEGPAMAAGDPADTSALNPDPLVEAEGMPYSAFDVAATREEPHLPDVYRDDPERYFKWEAEPVKKQVRLAARSGSPRDKRAASAAESVLGLNREELLALRWSVYADLELLRDILKELPPEGQMAKRVRAQIREMMSGQGEFAGMVRYFVRDEWKMAL